MKANVIIVKSDDIYKDYVDLSDSNNIKAAINATGLSTIHTVKTQEISKILGIHLVGYVDRHGSGENNENACLVSGYDFLGSDMILFKTDDKWNDYPLDEYEIERVFTYLVELKILPEKRSNLDKEFCERYGVKPLLPDLPVSPIPLGMPEVPYVLVLQYRIEGLSEKLSEEVANEVEDYSDKLPGEEKGFLPEDGKYYINAFVTPDYEYLYVLLQAKVEEADEPIIVNAESVVEALVNPKDNKGQGGDPETTMEEAID